MDAQTTTSPGHAHLVPSAALPGERVRAACGRLITLDEHRRPRLAYCPACQRAEAQGTLDTEHADRQHRIRRAALDAHRETVAALEREARRRDALAALAARRA